MTGIHRADQAGKARNAVAGALTAGALLLAPVAVAVAGAGIANAAPPTGPGTGGGAGGAGCTANPALCNPTSTTTKNTIRLPGLKIEVKNTRNDHKPPKIKIVPLPGLGHLLGL